MVSGLLCGPSRGRETEQKLNLKLVHRTFLNALSVTNARYKKFDLEVT